MVIFYSSKEIYLSVTSVNVSLVPSRPISIKLGSLDVFLLEINEFSKKKHYSALHWNIANRWSLLDKKPVIRSGKDETLIENKKIIGFEYGL